MNTILIIDTSTSFLSLALIDIEGKLVKSYLSDEKKNHAKNITIAIETILKERKLEYKSLSAIAINKGPGSFTGLRVGSSIAKGLCFALDIPLIGLAGLEEYGKYYYNQNKENCTDVFCMIDARRENYFYTQIYQGKVIQPTVLNAKKEIDKKIAASAKPFIINNNIDFNKMIAEYLSEGTLKKYIEQVFENIETVEPNYYINNYESK